MFLYFCTILLLKTSLTILFICCNFILEAQRFDGGITAGIVGSQLDGDHFSGYDKAGYVAGAFVCTKLGDRYGMQLEIKYIQKGSRAMDSSGSGSFGYYRSKLNYIEIPVFLNYLYKEKFKGEIGVGGGYLISAYEDLDGYGYEKAYPEFNKFEMTGTAGVSYIFSEKFLVTFRFTYSLLPVRPDYPGAYRYIDRGEYNNLLSIVFFYNFKKS